MFVTFRAKAFQVTNSPKILQVINCLSLQKLMIMAVYRIPDIIDHHKSSSIGQSHWSVHPWGDIDIREPLCHPAEHETWLSGQPFLDVSMSCDHPRGKVGAIKRSGEWPGENKPSIPAVRATNMNESFNNSC